MNQENIAKKNEALERLFRRQCPQGPITKENQNEHTMFTNSLQMVLWIRHFGEPPKVDQIDEWQGVFSINFRKSFEEVISGNEKEDIPADPLFFSGYATIGDIPEEKWQRLESSIYA